MDEFLGILIRIVYGVFGLCAIALGVYLLPIVAIKIIGAIILLIVGMCGLAVALFRP